MHERNAGVSVLFGAPGTGKTTLVARVIRARLDAGQRVLVCDLTGDLVRAVLDGWTPPEPVLRFSTAQQYKLASQPSLFGSVTVGKPGQLVAIDAEQSLASAVALFLAIVQKRDRRALYDVIVCDEAEQLFPTTHTDPQLKEALLFARNERREYWFAIKRPTAVSPIVRSAAKRACVFRLSSDADAAACSELGPSRLFRGVNGGRGVQSLATGKFVLYTGAEWTDDGLPVLDSLANSENLNPALR